MARARSLAVAVAVAAVLYLALDSGVVTSEPAPPGTSVALAVLATIFGLGAWVMQKGGQPERVPLLAGLAVGLGAYAVLRIVAL